MKRLLSLLLAISASAIALPAQAKLKVVTTTQDPGAITRAIGGDRVSVTSLCKGYQDPHFLDAKPSFMLELNKADLMEVIGLDLEIGYVPSLVQGARNPKIQPGQDGYLDLSQFITPLEVIAVADRGQGDIHPNGNPHYWTDPENGRLMARGIAERLTKLDPGGKDVYAKNLADFEKQLDAKEAEWAKAMEPLKGKPIITYHKSWSYFAKRYDLDVVGFVEPKPGIPPTPAHTLEIIKLVQEKGAKVILMESFYDKRVPDLMAAKSGAHVASVPNSVGGEDGVNDYFGLFDKIVGTVAKAAAGS
jgi:zinc/manganese transport system substrate-binding protein